MQEETRVALFVHGNTNTLIARRRRRISRMVRLNRQTACEKLQELGYDTTQALLTRNTEAVQQLGRGN